MAIITDLRSFIDLFGGCDDNGARLNIGSKGNTKQSKKKTMDSHSEIPTPTIAELWREFDGLIRLSIPHLSKLVSPGYSVEDALRPEYKLQLNQCNERLTELRDQLLERTETEWGMQIKKVKRNGIPEMMVVFDHGVLFLNSNDANDLGSCLKFGAWELKQRQKEQSAT